jgi:CPA2 family monovalent cation:H+ antiporter-2
MIISESDLSHRILGEVLPLRDILAGLFFVSVGMLVDPRFVWENLPLVLLALALIVVAKGLITTLLIWGFTRSARTALLTGVLLAQAGEFSFLLARQGTEAGAISASAFSLMLAAAVGSILISPSLYRLAGPGARWLEGRLPASPVAQRLAEEAKGDPPLRRHAVVCGYGRVGRVIGAALHRRGLPFVVIEHDLELVRRLRERGIPAIPGNADNPVLLERANLKQARLLVVAVPDALAARLIVDYAREAHPELEVVVRSHSLELVESLRRQGVDEVVMGELELSLEMARRTLRRFGVSAMETLAIVQGLRQRAIASEESEALDLTP